MVTAASSLLLRFFVQEPGWPRTRPTWRLRFSFEVTTPQRVPLCGGGRCSVCFRRAEISYSASRYLHSVAPAVTVASAGLHSLVEPGVGHFCCPPSRLQEGCNLDAKIWHLLLKIPLGDVVKVLLSSLVHATPCALLCTSRGSTAAFRSNSFRGTNTSLLLNSASNCGGLTNV